MLPVRPELAGLHPYGAPQLDVPVRLNTNENPYPPPQAVVEEIAEAARAAAAGLNRYPDRDFAALRADLAGYLATESGVHLDPAGIWAANASNEVMLHVLQAFGGPGRTVLSFAPTYSMYPEYARDTFTTWVAGRRGEDFSVDPDHAAQLIDEVRPSVVLLASPNNPTGTALPLTTTRAVLDAAAQVPGGCVVVVDEAYAEFRRPGTPSATALLAGHRHLAVVRTMSKAFALAGARVGYLAAAPELVDTLRLVRLPYHLSSVTQAVARAALAHTAELMAQVGALRDERDRWVGALRARGLQVPDSDANFVLVGVFDDAHMVWQGLLDRGVLVRDAGPAGWLRVSVGTAQEMAAFGAALDEVVEQ
ncbi:MAG: histidinol-phosphate transaminase [Micrococcales bacterium]|nr:histidinol-phosphate transaminase [Micrococcales bacterium]